MNPVNRRAVLAADFRTALLQRDSGFGVIRGNVAVQGRSFRLENHSVFTDGVLDDIREVTLSDRVNRELETVRLP